ncbi:MAG: cytochrome c [Candidatus Manganitrophaceae bacterium]
MKINHDWTRVAWIMLGLSIGIPLAAEAAGDASKGRPVYEKYCLLCHGPEGRGDGPQGQLMKPPAANFKTPESRKKTDAELLKTIREGHPDSAMTRWKGILTEEPEMLNLLAYIRKLGGPPEKGL